MWVAPALERSDEYMRWRTCLRCKAVNSKKLLRRQTENGWHLPCYWLPFTSVRVIQQQHCVRYSSTRYLFPSSMIRSAQSERE